jgi:crossover junction endodeoxyribonuclease RuvC
VDTSLRSTGVGVVAAAGSRTQAVWYGRIRNPPDRPLSACLLALSDAIGGIIETHHPEAVSIEGVFFAKNLRTTLVLGEARGAVLAQCARQGVPVYEYEPRRVKQAVVGYGNAAKEQVQRMVMSLLALDAPPPEDAADALALAICHLHNRTRLRLTGIAPI